MFGVQVVYGFVLTMAVEWGISVAKAGLGVRRSVSSTMASIEAEISVFIIKPDFGLI